MSIKARIIGATCAVCVVASGYVFSQRSWSNIVETHEDLQLLSKCALQHSPVDFVVIDGLRTEEEHRINVANGRSWIKRSRHQDGMAIDFAAYVNGAITYEPSPYYKIAAAFFYCSEKHNVPIVWGGDWRVKDLMHVELDREYYP
jgi:peptidoglycan L-alanyl-D-glutamate endopeptidase CwlK